MWRSIYHELRRWAKVSRCAAAAYKRTLITVETDEVWVIQKSGATRGWCAECGKEVNMVSLKEAETLSGMTQPGMSPPMPNQSPATQPMLPGCGEGPGWHWSQAADGSLLVCLESLLKRGA
jgi:hypothetical protein